MGKLSRFSTLGVLVLGLALAVPSSGAESQILFDGEGIDGENWGIWTMDPDGANRSLIYWACDKTYGSWSPTGDNIIFTGDGTDWLHRVDVEDPTYCDAAPVIIASSSGFEITEDSPLFNVPAWEWLEEADYQGAVSAAKWSPSTSRDEVVVATEIDDPLTGIIAVADPWVYNEKVIPIYATQSALVDDPVWNADGSMLAFIESPHDGSGDVLKIMDRETGAVEVKTWSPEDVGSPDGRFVWLDWAKSDPNSRMFAFGAYAPTHGNHGEWRIYVVELVGDSPQAVNIAVGIDPSWSPDDQHLVYSYRSKRIAEWQIRRIDLLTSDVTTLVSGDTFGRSPDWSRGSSSTCDDGDCDPGENPCNCPSDCGPPSEEIIPLCEDGLDNDCDGQVDDWDSGCCPDADGDGFTSDACGGLDCDDSTALAFPDGPEPDYCFDEFDNDCDGLLNCADDDCFGEPLCEVCLPQGADCTWGPDCCSGRCHHKRKVCMNS